MNRSLLTPRWLLLHVLFLAAIIATGLLTWWQWSRAHEAGGSFQNLGYALQWPLFGAFTAFLWYRLIHMNLHDQKEAGEAPEAVETVTAEVSPAEESERRRPLVPPPARPVDAEEDPELAAYNQYLAELNEGARRD